MGLRHRASSLRLLSLSLGLAVLLVSGNSVAGWRLRRPFAPPVCIAVDRFCLFLLVLCFCRHCCGVVSRTPVICLVNSSSSFEVLGTMLYWSHISLSEYG